MTFYKYCDKHIFEEWLSNINQKISTLSTENESNQKRESSDSEYFKSPENPFNMNQVTKIPTDVLTFLEDYPFCSDMMYSKKTNTVYYEKWMSTNLGKFYTTFSEDGGTPESINLDLERILKLWETNFSTITIEKVDSLPAKLEELSR